MTLGETVAIIISAAGAAINGGVVWAAFEVQRRQANADRNLALVQEAQVLLGVTVAIGEAYATFSTSARRTAEAAHVQGLKSELLVLKWAERMSNHYLSRNPSDYILVQDLFRVVSTLESAIKQMEYAI